MTPGVTAAARPAASPPFFATLNGVLWSNVGNVFEAFLRKLEAIDAGRSDLAHARWRLASPRSTAGTATRCFEPVRPLDGRRIRRVCCMRHLVPSEVVCGVCPLGPANPARQAGDAPQGGQARPQAGRGSV
jgi:ferric iron reductase protein FhuF